MLDDILIGVRRFFTSREHFESEEWILHHQISALLITSFGLGIGIFLFALYRMGHGNTVAGVAQLFFSLFLLVGFIKLRKDKAFYPIYSITFFILFFLYIHIVFFFVPQNHLNILWIITAPVLIFFFLDKKGGIIIFLLLLGFIGYLLLIGYPYTIAEYITLFATLSTSTLIMYAYEKVKEAERNRLVAYNKTLQSEITKHTQRLQEVNTNLELRVKEEVERRLTHEQILLRQSRMASMGEMIDSIAHQWRQPLMNINAVMMNIDQGIEQQKDPELLRERLLEVFSLTAHMSHTIDDFRDLLKEEKEKRRFVVAEVIESVLILMKNNLKGVRLSLHMDRAIAIRSYQSELSQVMIILLSNAIETLHHRAIKDRQIDISLLQIDDNVKITIEDNAYGIEVKEIEKIFDPYFTTKEQMGGTGLGLYIAKIIVEHNMQGRLSVCNSTDGAKFTVTLPKDDTP